MSKFTLNWFKSQKKNKLAKMIIQQQSIIDDFIDKPFEKPYKKLKLVNDVLTVILNNGDILSKTSCSVDNFNEIKQAKDESTVISLLKSTNNQDIQIEILKNQNMTEISSNFHLLKSLTDFNVFEKSVKLVGVDRTLPELLIFKFIQIVSKHKDKFGDLQKFCDEDVEYVALKRFFMWCCLNPRVEVANELYRFLIENSFRITKQGFFVALRNVVSLQTENGRNMKVQFISNTYNKIKAVWKKNPKYFDVLHCGEEFKIVDLVRGKALPDDNLNWERLGNLKELYLDLPNMQENRFTDEWTKTFDIRIGKIVSMPMEDCNWSTQDCAAAGLHFTANEINYVGCGDTSVLMLINPMKVVGIGQKKGRCYEYLPIMTLPREEATQILYDLDFDTIDLDEFYVEDQLNDLIEKAKQGFTAEATKYEFNLPAISSIDIKNIVNSLNQMKNDISERVQKVI